MYITQLQLKNYRNYDELDLTLSPNINIFIGNNAQGKTNILESIYVLAMTNSHRTTRWKELIRFSCHETLMKTSLVKNSGMSLTLEIEMTNEGRKYKVNHLVQQKASQYFTNMNVILFSPEDLSLVKGSPGQRRQFLDREIGQLYPKYLYEMIQYKHILKQRNTYLKQVKSVDETYLTILDEQLSEVAAELMLERQAFIAELEGIANEIHQTLSLNKEKMTLQYESTFPLDTMTKEQIKETFFKQLQARHERDIHYHQTTIGLQKEDVIILLNGTNAQHFASQGQQRLIVLSLKLAEVQLLYKKNGDYPILLLDDVMSELDDERQMRLMETIEGKVQTFITTTTLSHLQNKMNVTPAIFTVNDGQIIKEENKDSGK